MIELVLNGSIVELKRDTSINFKLVNPIFNQDGLSPGSYTLPFDLAGAESSPKNAATFKHPHVIENVDVFVNQAASIKFDGILYKTGKIKPREISDDKINANMIFGLSTISDDFKTAKIRDIIAEEIVISAADLTKKIFIKPAGAATTPYRIIVNGKAFEGATLAALATAINNDTDEPRALATEITVGNSSGGFTPPYLQLTSRNDVNNPLAPLSIDIEDNLVFGPAPTYTFAGYKWSYHGELGDQNFTIYYDQFWAALQGYFTGAYPTDKIRFPAVFNLRGVEWTSIVQAPLLYNGITTFNGTSSLNLVKNRVINQNDFMIENRNGIQPFLRLKYLLDAIGDHFGFQYEGDWYNSVDTGNMLIWNTASLDEFMPFIGKSMFRFWKRSFNMKDLVPDLSVVDFFKALQKRYNLAVYLNEQTGKVKLQTRESIAKAIAYTDITNLCSPIQSIIDERIAGFKLLAKKDSKDLLAVDDTFLIGEAEETIESTISALPQTFEITGPPTPIAYYWYSWVTQNINGPLVNQADEDDDNPSFRIFYYQGLYNNGSISYPKASINAANYNEVYSGLNGLYEKFWHRWLQYEMNRRGVKINIAYPFRDLIDLDWELKRRFDRNNYLIKSLDFSMEPTGITICKAELYTMV